MIGFVRGHEYDHPCSQGSKHGKRNILCVFRDCIGGRTWHFVVTNEDTFEGAAVEFRIMFVLD
jgi:hypothetical protein